MSVPQGFIVWHMACSNFGMATKYNVREVARRLSEGQIDPNSVMGLEILQEIAERVLRVSSSELESVPSQSSPG